ncbi:helix-turn-helix domain-containing protein [Pseudomonas sp. TNT11]|uniref:Helix-turn-helix domain-containing protein n=1 Tax=Pseudomonas emilianonis TaxID=2915812 RepID=A0ABT0EMZ0_9PSED|nr:helix-turn-helix domain-containing protein [Pseudomonas emilianonis]MCK1786864.1 helix-turn-helix domain-containing protein [Pseudomonas emilianonis]
MAIIPVLRVGQGDIIPLRRRCCIQTLLELQLAILLQHLERAPTRGTPNGFFTGLSQARFAKAIDVPVGTLQNWEQGRREPEGPARALLRALYNDPGHVLAALEHR